MVCLCEGLVFVWCCLRDGAFCVRGSVWGAMFWGCYGFLCRGCCFVFLSGRFATPRRFEAFEIPLAKKLMQKAYYAPPSAADSMPSARARTSVAR